MKWTKQKVNNLFFFLGVAVVVVMLFTFDVSFVELWQHLCHAGYWLIPIIGIWALIYAINAWAWLVIIRGNSDGDLLPLTSHLSIISTQPFMGASSTMTNASVSSPTMRYSTAIIAIVSVRIRHGTVRWHSPSRNSNSLRWVIISCMSIMVSVSSEDW